MTAQQRLVVRHLTDAERRWMDEGRPYFLNRTGFEAQQRSRMNTTAAQTPDPLGHLVGLAILLLPFYLLWRYTAWTFPSLSGVTGPLFRVVGNLLRSLQYRLWSKPVNEHGIGQTLWCWWSMGAVLFGVLCLLAGDWLAALGVIPMLLIAVAWWHILRWWRQRRFRPRPLPRRRLP